MVAVSVLKYDQETTYQTQFSYGERQLLDQSCYFDVEGFSVPTKSID